MSISLFPHNQRAYRALTGMIETEHRACIIHPTGTGKSFIGFKYCEDHPEKAVLWLSPSEYIFKTQIENLKAATNGWQPENLSFLTYAKLLQLCTEEISELNPDAIIFDEFHRCGAEQWGKGVQRLLNAYSNIPILGLTATNIRYLDNQRDMADELFDNCVASQMTLGEAIATGILAAPKYVIAVFSFEEDLKNYEAKVRRTRNKAVRKKAEEYLEKIRRAIERADGLDTIFKKHITEEYGKYILFVPFLSCQA
ncbi:MAG: DEAD/DEAH box helicase family protein [Paludibacteraceae bacterium]|nr:DEAD/DEAH box helicase family protein [Paludibacteraceae bacterium]